MDNWHDFNKEVPQKAGEYLVAFYPVSFDRINNERMHVGIDVFRGGKRILRDSWAKHKSSYVCFWMEFPDVPPTDMWSKSKPYEGE